MPLKGRSAVSTLGRKSWLFCGSDRGGVQAAAMYTLIGTAKLNNHRLLGPIGNIPPAEAEANHYAASENLDMAA